MHAHACACIVSPVPWGAYLADHSYGALEGAVGLAVEALEGACDGALGVEVRVSLTGQLGHQDTCGFARGLMCHDCTCVVTLP